MHMTQSRMERDPHSAEAGTAGSRFTTWHRLKSKRDRLESEKVPLPQRLRLSSGHS